MRLLRLMASVAAALSAASQPRPDPRAISIHPFAGHPGTTFVATVRGSGLQGTLSVIAEDGASLRMAVDRIEAEPAEISGPRNKVPIDLVSVRVEVPAGTKPGRYPIRLVTRDGVSNALPIHVVPLAVTPELAGNHGTQESAVPVPGAPAIMAGRLSRRGEADYYAIRVEAGQTLTFELVSGFPQTAAGGSAATIPFFDPHLSLFRPEGSWLDPQRLKRIAHNDEPAWVIGKPTDAHLIHQFKEPGTYLLRVEAFAGQGGPDYSYYLKVAPGALPQDLPPAVPKWSERSWTRKLSSNRLNELAARGGKPADQKSIETYRALPEGISFKLPGTVEGALAQPGESHRARFRLEQPADIAIELETPSAAPPFFNPIVRLLDGAGEEVATNVLAGKGACSGALTKSHQSKTILPLRNTGEYTLEVRDATSDLGGPEFQYRMQVRPQVPHVGDVEVSADHLNLAPGDAKTIRIMFDREENYRGAVAVLAEAPPPGVSAATGADFEPDTDPPSTPSKRERYVGRTERGVLVFSASADAAPSTQPQNVKVVVRPLVDGKLGEPLATKTLPLMVIAKQ